MERVVDALCEVEALGGGGAGGSADLPPTGSATGGATGSAAASTTIGAYRLVEQLGAGAHATVYRAYRDGSLAAAAVKLFHRPLTGRALDRVWREIGLLERLRLPCLPRLLDHGQFDGRPFLVTEFIDGWRLDEHCRRRGLGRDDRIELLASVADAVQSIHDAGVTHRDLKPSNVLVDRCGRPIILDLGTAATTEQAGFDLTLTGAPVGTPAFMPPEQARGVDQPDAAADIWSLGAMSWLLLVGRTPHGECRSVVEMLRRSADVPAEPAAHACPSLPPALGAVLDRSVAFEPSRRHGSAAELAADLRRVRHGHAPMLADAPARHPSPRTRRALAGALLALVTAAALVAASGREGRPASAPPAHVAWVSPDGRCAGLMDLAGHVVWRRDAGAPGALTRATVMEPADAPDRRGLFIVGEAATSPGGAGRLVAFDLADPSIERWSAGVVGEDLVPPRWISQVDRSRFGVAHLRVLDVFPRPGAEIVAIHQHWPSSPACIRVYDAAGSVLHEVWHDGNIEDIRWLPEPRLLVFVGVNAEAFWDERGVQSVGHAHYPRVLFAIRPTLERRGFTRTPGGRGVVEASWYLALLPAALSGGGQGLDGPETALEPPGHDLPPERCFRLCATIAGAPPRSLAFVFDEHGQELRQHREAKSAYSATLGLPDPAAFSFGPLPPIVALRQGRTVE